MRMRVITRSSGGWRASEAGQGGADWLTELVVGEDTGCRGLNNLNKCCTYLWSICKEFIEVCDWNSIYYIHFYSSPGKQQYSAIQWLILPTGLVYSLSSSVRFCILGVEI